MSERARTRLVGVGRRPAELRENGADSQTANIAVQFMFMLFADV